MELTREHFCSIYVDNFRSGLSQEWIDELKSLFGNKAPFYGTVKNCFNEFKRGRNSLKDKVREGPPKTASSPNNIDAVREVIRSSCDIPWDRVILGHFTQQHTFNIAWKPGRKKDLFSKDNAQFDKRSIKGSCRLMHRNVGKIQWRCHKRRL